LPFSQGRKNQASKLDWPEIRFLSTPAEITGYEH
jgi:hypothetical protein